MRESLTPFWRYSGGPAGLRDERVRPQQMVDLGPQGDGRADPVSSAEPKPPAARAGVHLEQHLGVPREMLEHRFQVADQSLVARARVDLEHDRLDAHGSPAP